MKRTALLTLILIYTLSCLGVSAEQYYCCGKLARTAFTIGDIGYKEVKTDKPDKCCKTTKQSYKVKDSHLSVKTDLSFDQSFAVVTPVFLVPGSPEQAEPVVLYAYDSQAPPVNRNPLYLLYANFRI